MRRLASPRVNLRITLARVPSSEAQSARARFGILLAAGGAILQVHVPAPHRVSHSNFQRKHRVENIGIIFPM